MIFKLEEDLPFDIQGNLNEYWLNILERNNFKVIEINKKTRELEYRIELMSLDDLRKLQKKIGLNLTISFEDDEGTNEVDGIIIIQEIKYMRVNFTIEGPPIGKARPRVTRTVTYTPAKTARYEDLVRYTAINSFKGIFDKDEPLDVKIMAYFEVPKSLSKKRKALCLANQELPTKKPDADNVGKIIMDGMNPKMRRDKRLHKMVEVMRGVYHDDKQVTALLVKKRYAERARVDVRIKRDMGDQMQKIDLSLVSKFVDASIANDKRLALKLAKKIAEQHNCSLSFELDTLDWSANWLKSDERVATQSMVRELRKYEAQCRINQYSRDANLLRCCRICGVLSMSNNLKYQKGKWYHVQEDGSLKPVDYDKEVEEYYKKWRDNYGN